MAGFALANLLGMTIVIVAVQFFFDVRPLFQEGDGLLSPTRIVVAKRISSLRTLTRKPPTFTQQDIDDIAQQPFVKRVDPFVSSQFQVEASLGVESMGATFSTEMFFEAVPDACIDIDRSLWVDPLDSDTLPIILPKNYLNLYNFGYAGARGMPTFSEGIVSKMPIHLTLYGATEEWQKWGKVVGFSKRLNTILVPLSFMQRANRTLTGTLEPPPSRLIITVNNPADERIATFLTVNRDVAMGHSGSVDHWLVHHRFGFLRTIAEHLPSVAETYRQDRHAAAGRLSAQQHHTILPSHCHLAQSCGDVALCRYRHLGTRGVCRAFRPMVRAL